MIAILLFAAAASHPCASAPRPTSNGILLPVAIKRVEPDFSACKGSHAGMPVIETTIDTTGRPKKIRVIRSVSQCVDRASIAAVKQWTFCPAERDGKPIEMKMTLKVFVHYR